MWVLPIDNQNGVGFGAPFSPTAKEGKTNCAHSGLSHRLVFDYACTNIYSIRLIPLPRTLNQETLLYMTVQIGALAFFFQHLYTVYQIEPTYQLKYSKSSSPARPWNPLPYNLRGWKPRRRLP